MTPSFVQQSAIFPLPPGEHRDTHGATDVQTPQIKISSRQEVSLNDLIDDLDEIAYLLDDLSAKLPGEELIAPGPAAELLTSGLQARFGNDIALLKASFRRTQDAVRRLQRGSQSQQGSSSPELTGAIEQLRKEVLAIKSALRIMYRQRGVVYCAMDWQSPAYNSSLPPERNRLWQGIEAHKLDYKRDGHLDAEVYEKAFLREYACHLGSDRLQAYLTNCGMAAFSTVLHLLAHELDAGQVTVGIEPMYFENVHLLRPFFPGLQLVTADSREHLRRTLQQIRPAVIFFDASSNRGQTFNHDFDSICQWAMGADHPVTLIVDNTCVPTSLLRSGLLSKLPPRVSVILIESLAKYHQFGMDAVTGGIILCHADETLNRHIKKAREVLGTNITDTSVPSLPAPDRQALSRRLIRLSRNLRFLAEVIEEHLTEHSSDHSIESIAWLRDGVPGITNEVYRGTCLTIRLKKDFRSVAHYRQFENRVVELAQQAEYPVLLGTSFGFDITRLFITTPATPFEEPYMRLSIGTETAVEVESLARLILTASQELMSAWD